METTQTLSELAKGLTLTHTCSPKLPYEKRDDWQKSATGYRCRLRYQGRSYSFDYWMGSAHTEPPTAPECINSLLSDADAGGQSFGDFCSDFGYDEDSRKAHANWRACIRINDAMQKLLGEDYEAFLYAERDI